MRLLHISDTHGRHKELQRLPDAYILVHSGDFTLDGKEQEAIDFINPNRSLERDLSLYF